MDMKKRFMYKNIKGDESLPFLRCNFSELICYKSINQKTTL